MHFPDCKPMPCISWRWRVTCELQVVNESILELLILWYKDSPDQLSTDNSSQQWNSFGYCLLKVTTDTLNFSLQLWIRLFYRLCVNTNKNMFVIVIYQGISNVSMFVSLLLYYVDFLLISNFCLMRALIILGKLDTQFWY